MDAATLLQDAFVRAWQRLATFRGDSALTTWLHRLTVNCFLEESRKTRRREARVELHEIGDLGASSTPDTSKAVEARLDLEAALPRLPEGARRVFVLHDMYGYRHEEIATLLGVAAATVRVQLFRARKQLMEILDR
jgi:RNA polymerase sigma-70 factor (ECF subfamily)